MTTSTLGELDLDEAALQLGMTAESLRRVLAQLHLPQSRGGTVADPRFAIEDLEAFRNSYLPRFKTWGSRSGLFREFHRNLRAATGLAIDEQPCEVDGCDNLASARCANPDCREDGPPRAMCPRHGEHLARHNEGDLCATCVRRVVKGELGYELARSPESLKKEYGDG